MLRFFKNLVTNNSGTPVHVVSETTVEAYLDTISGNCRESDPVANLVANLVAHARRCAHLVEQAPHDHSPVHLAHTVAAVVAALAQMGESTSAYVIEHWSRIGAAYAGPAADHLWQALESLALTAGLLDAAVPAPAPLHPGNALAALQEAAAECAQRV